MKSYKQTINEAIKKEQFRKILKDREIYAGCEFEVVLSVSGQVSGSALFPAAHKAWSEWNSVYKEYFRQLSNLRDVLEKKFAAHFRILNDLSEESIFSGIWEIVDPRYSPPFVFDKKFKRSSNFSKYINDPKYSEKPEELRLEFKPIKIPIPYDEVDIEELGLDDIFSEFDEIYPNPPKAFTIKIYPKPEDRSALDSYNKYIKNIELIKEFVDNWNALVDEDDSQFEYLRDTNRELLKLKRSDNYELDQNSQYVRYMEEIQNIVNYKKTDYDGEIEYVEPEDVESEEAGVLESGKSFFEDSPVGYSELEVGTYHSTNKQNLGDRHWRLENDSSLPEGGVEIISPPMRLPDFLEMVEEMFDYISETARTTQECGFHVSISMPNMEKIDIIKLMLFLDEGYLYRSSSFRDRKNNRFAVSVQNLLTKNDSLNRSLSDLSSKLYKNIRMYPGHLDAVNTEHMPKYIEFRYMGGEDYDRKFKAVRESIALYCYAFKAAIDPEFEKNVYLKKINRLRRNIELATIHKRLYDLKELLNKAEKNDKKSIDDINKKIKLITARRELILSQIKPERRDTINFAAAKLADSTFNVYNKSVYDNYLRIFKLG